MFKKGMKRFSLFLICISLMTSFGFILPVAPVKAMGTCGQLSVDFSKTQGQNQFYYMQWDGTKYSNMTWDSSNSRWVGSQAYCLIGSGWLHPDTNEPVIAWVAQCSGIVQITAGNGTISSPNSGSGADGVNVKILKDTSNVWPLSGWQSISPGSSISFPTQTISVEAMETIYFIVDKNANSLFDTTYWDPIIQYTSMSTYTMNTGYSNVQGQGQWYYKQWDGSTYSDMSWDTTNKLWRGAYTFNLIYNGAFHPDENDSVLAWRAPRDGTISINSKSISVASGGDGVYVKAMKGSSNVWPASGWQYISAGGSVTFPKTTLDVSQNEYIYFIVNKYGNNSCDTTYWSPELSYMPDNKSYHFSTDVTNIQGENCWYCMEWDGISFSQMTWDASNDRWQGHNATARACSGYIHPGETNDVAIKWVAPRSGYIKIEGCTVTNGDTGGDGVYVQVLKDLAFQDPSIANIWPASGYQYISAAGSVTFPEWNMSVNRGDAIYFVVNRNSTTYFDSTNWDPVITYCGVDSYQQFSDLSRVQGLNEWYYQQWDGTSYSSMTWNTSLNMWVGDQTFCRVFRGGMHPDTNNAVMEWKAPRTGTIKISAGSIWVPNAGGDGVKVKVLKGTTNVWPSSGWQSISAASSVSFPETTVTVAKDDILYFIGNKNVNNTCDTIYWNPIINYVSDAQQGINPAFSDSYKYSLGYSGTQGQNQWYYMQYNGSTYNNMTYDSSTALWTGSYTGCTIGNGVISPYTNDAVMAWKAPKAGTVSIMGMMDHNSLLGDGVKCKIMKNSSGTVTQIWPSSGLQSLAPNFTAQHAFQVTVAQDDYIYFQINQNSSTGNDTTFWDPVVSYTDKPEYTLDKAEVVMTTTDCNNMGVTLFDSSISIVPNGTNYDFYDSAQGREVVKWTGTLAQPAQTAVYCKSPDSAFTNPNSVEGYWWISNMYKDTDGGLLAFCHLEGCADGGFWALGLAYSDDGGSTFEILGKIVTQNYPDNTIDQPKADRNIYGLGYAVKDGYFYVYYGDNMPEPYTKYPAVCRAPVADVLSAAKNGTVTEWKKYYNGAWNEDGMGGKATPVIAGSGQYDWETHGDAAYSSTLGKFVLMGFNQSDGMGEWIAFSDDGVNFGHPSFIINSYSGKTSKSMNIYDTLIGSDGSDNGVIGSSFYIYWSQRNDYNAPLNSQICRQLVTVNLTGFSQPTFDAAVDFNKVDQGLRQWYYLDSDGSTYLNMASNKYNSRWTGHANDQSLIGANWQQPGTATDSVRKWVAPKAGIITITANGGVINVATGTGADGVKVKVLKNTTNVWPSQGWQTISAGGSVTFSQQTVTVAAGDAIYFIVNRNSNNSYDTTTWEPIIQYQ